VTLTATYSPEDNKLRLYATARLEPAVYARVKANGFIWAPKQDLFVAPAWTPDREDFLLQLCGDIGDEDTTLVDRAEQRAERFEGYSEKRLSEAEAAKAAVDAIADNIPLGQPILVGHHSEARARRDAEKIQNGMRRAVNLWKTSTYWTQRAKGALHHAKYKELPAVRFRRIKTIESDVRRQQKRIDEAQRFMKMWTREDVVLNLARARAIAALDHVYMPAGAKGYADTTWYGLDKGEIQPEQARDRSIEIHTRTVAWAERWLAHLNNRLAYERAMLAEQGGVITDRSEYPIVVGGRVRVGEEWLVVLKVNRGPSVNGATRIVSVRTQPPADGYRTHWCSKIPIEKIKDYQPPEDAKAVKAAKAVTKLPPLVNYRLPGCLDMTTDDFRRRQRSGLAATRRVAATDTVGAHRQRESMKSGYGGLAPVFLTDAKVVEPPTPAESPNPKPLERKRA
jgi:uncharacterized protein DUF3560